MKHWKILLPATLLISVLWLACRDQEYNNNYQQQVDVAFAGRVIDEDGQPIEGAQVRADGELAVTDVNGVFRTKTVQMPARDAKLTVTRIGYFDFSRAFIVQDDALQTVTIQLLRKQLVVERVGARGVRAVYSRDAHGARNIDDLLGAERRPNVPGTIDEHPNWRIPLPTPLDDLGATPLADRIVDAIGSDRR